MALLKRKRKTETIKPIDEPEVTVKVIDNSDVEAITKYHSNTFEYYSFQPDAVKYMTARDKCILGLPTGTGKTAISFGVYAVHKIKNPNLKLIFVTDKSVIQQASLSATEFLTLKNEYIYGDTKRYREQVYKEFTEGQFDILILNYAMLRQDVEYFEDLFEDIGADNILLVFDEANYIAGIDSKIHSIAKGMISFVKNCYLMTATVSKGKLEDYFNLLLALGINKHSLYEFRETFGNYGISISTRVFHKKKTLGYGYSYEGKTHWHIRFDIGKATGWYNIRLYNEDKTGMRVCQDTTIGLDIPKDRLEGGENKYINIAIVFTFFNKKTKQEQRGNHAITFNVRSMFKLLGYRNLNKFVDLYNDCIYSRSKKEIAPHLPPFTRKMYQVDEDKDTHLAIVKMYKDFDYEPKHSQLNVALTYPEYVEDYKPKNRYNSKVDKLFDVVDSLSGEKAIIYHSSKQSINHMYDLFVEAGYKCSRITGDIVKTREQEKLDFVEGNNQLMFITDAGGVGVDSLQVAGNIIFAGMPITGGQLIQIAGRISRINTKRKNLTLHYILTKNTFDEDKYHAVMSQVKLIAKLDPNGVDEGLRDHTVTDSMTKEEGDSFIREQIWSRKKQYSK